MALFDSQIDPNNLPLILRILRGRGGPTMPGAPSSSPIAPASPAPSSPLAASAPASQIPPLGAPPTPQVSATSRLLTRAEQIKNPLLRAAGTVGAGLLKGADVFAGGAAPKIMGQLSGSTLGTQLGNQQRLDDWQKAQQLETGRLAQTEKPEIAQLNADTRAQIAAERAENAKDLAAQRGDIEKQIQGMRDTAKANASPFEQWQQQNPGAPVADWFKTSVGGKQANDAYHYWLASHPNGAYDDFLKDVQQYKGNPRMSGLGAYALGRVIDAASRYDPRLEALIPSLAQELGVNTGGLDLSGPPIGQPRNEAGEAIGLAQPESPTTTTRSRGQFAQSGVVDQIPNLKKEIKALGSNLGPVSGRWNELMTGRIGADNPQFAGLRTGLSNLATAWMRLHANSDAARIEFENMLSRSKTPADLVATLDAIGRQATDYAKQGKGNQPESAKSPKRPKGVPASATWNGQLWVLPQAQ